MGAEIIGYAQYRDNETNFFRAVELYKSNGEYAFYSLPSIGAGVLQNLGSHVALKDRQSLDILYGTNDPDMDSATEWKRISLGALLAIKKTANKKSDKYKVAKMISNFLTIATDLGDAFVENEYDDIVFTFFVSY